MARTLENFIRNLRRGVGDSFSKKLMSEFGNLAIDSIVKRTRSGKGTDRTAGAEKGLKKLAPSYIKHRQRNSAKLDATTSPRKSNLTFTGQLLRSMRVKMATNSRVIWGPNKRKRKGGLTNEKLGEIVAQQGRPFNFMSKKDIAKMAKFFDKALQKNMRRL